MLYMLYNPHSSLPSSWVERDTFLVNPLLMRCISGNLKKYRNPNTPKNPRRDKTLPLQKFSAFHPAWPTHEGATKLTPKYHLLAEKKFFFVGRVPAHLPSLRLVEVAYDKRRDCVARPGNLPYPSPTHNYDSNLSPTAPRCSITRLPN